MTSRDWIDSNPKACLAKDSAARAAQIIKQENAGPVPVVQDRYENRLVGIVTAHDLALKVVAEGRDPYSVTVEEIMSRNPVICREDETEQQIVSKMNRHQLRHIPVIDKHGRLIGIVSPKPGHGAAHLSFGTASTTLLAGFCIGIGAGLMFIFDPARGRRRRERIRDQAVQLSRQSSGFLGKVARDLKDRAQATVTTRPQTEPEPKPEQLDAAQMRWSPAARVLASTAGGSLLLLALAKGKR